VGARLMGVLVAILYGFVVGLAVMGAIWWIT
jgi:tetrahydromethanopterin S-methyltransferase subunit B